MKAPLWRISLALALCSSASCLSRQCEALRGCFRERAPLAPDRFSIKDIRLKGKAILVTGSTTGIGEGMVRLFAREGASSPWCKSGYVKGKMV
jgi:hypothetical protein